MVSVCLATFNGEKYLREQLVSILCQLSSDDEIVISDDGSTDKTLQIISEIKDERIKVFQNTKFHGVSGNFNNALKHSKGDVIFLSDQDDIWAKNKLQLCLSALEHFDLVVHNAELVDSNANSLGYDYFSFLKPLTGFFPNLWKFRFLGACMCFNRDKIYQYLPCPIHQAVLHDYWIYMMAAFWGKKIKCINAPLIQYRRHEATVTHSGKKSEMGLKFMINKRVSLIKFMLVWTIRKIL